MFFAFRFFKKSGRWTAIMIARWSCLAAKRPVPDERCFRLYFLTITSLQRTVLRQNVLFE